MIPRTCEDVIDSDADVSLRFSSRSVDSLCELVISFSSFSSAAQLSTDAVSCCGTVSAICVDVSSEGTSSETASLTDPTKLLSARL